MKFLIPLIFIIAAVAGFVVYTNPQYQALQVKMSEHQRIIEANKKAATLRAVRQELIDARNTIKEEDVDRLRKMLPDGVENVGLIIDINNVARDRGMEIRNTKISENTARGGGTAVGPDSKRYGVISLSFSVTSGYDNFLLFLRDLEDNLRLVDVTALSFTATKDGKYDFNLTLQTYWLK